MRYASNLLSAQGVKSEPAPIELVGHSVLTTIGVRPPTLLANIRQSDILFVIAHSVSFVDHQYLDRLVPISLLVCFGRRRRR